MPEKCPNVAAIRMTGTATEATRNCMSNGVPAPATARLPIMTKAMLSAEASGNIAAQPSSATLGRMISNTPPKAMIVATHFVAFVRSRRKMELRIAVIIGLVKPIAVASASGIKNIDEKKQMVAVATAKPLSSCTFGLGIAKPCHPSWMNSNVPSPMAPTE